MAQKKLAEEGHQSTEEGQTEVGLNFVNPASAETSPALSVSSDVLPMRRKATIEGSSFPFLLENSSPLENISSSNSPSISRRYTILPPGIPLDPVQDLTDILQETYLDSTLQDDAIFRDIINSDDNQAKSSSISIPNSPNLHSTRMPFMSNLAGAHPNGMFGFSNVISQSMASSFSNADLFEESTSVMEPFNDDLFSKSWSVHSTHREPRARTFTETSVQLSDNFGLTNLVPVDESIGF